MSEGVAVRWRARALPRATRCGARMIAGLALAAAVAAGCTGGAARPGTVETTVRRVDLDVGERTREVYVYAPLAQPPDGALLIAFHSSNSSGLQMRRMAGVTLEHMAREHGFVVAYPDGMWGYFDDCRKQASYRARTEHVDDVAFTRAIVARLAADERIDTHRVYALGYSNGGQMALRLALEAPDLVAGVIAIAANLPTPDNMDCTAADGHRPGVVLIEGTRDPLNPYDGGEISLLGIGKRGAVVSAQDTARWFADRYGLARAPQLDPAPIQYEDLVARTEVWGSAIPRVELISIEGGGHTMPVPDFRFSFALGRSFADPTPMEAAWSALQP